MGAVVESAPQILHAIVGTAGHVDHGKTSLVKLLTGCDTDRLPEEKARGMSIDLGFAPCLLHGRRLVGIVDVPGHKDFIRNMVAGAASIDVLLLVVAADDGVMPQTDEHVKLVNLLRKPLAVVALTKTDLVAPEMLELARQDVAVFLERTGFGAAPIIPVSNKTGQGVPEVREAIEALVERVRQREPDGRAFRMNVERVFSVKGYGTVVTGIPVSGQVRVGEKLQLLPDGRELTVRAIQSYKQESDIAVANCCCAINVRELDAAAVARGMTVASPGIYQATGELIASVGNATIDHTFARRFDARLHTGTGAVDASVKLLAGEQVGPGGSAFAHLALSEPIVVAAGDRFVLRSNSPGGTLGGGVVLSARAQRLRRGAAVGPRLAAAARAAERADLLTAELLAGPDPIVPAAEALRLTQRPPASAAETVTAAIEDGIIVNLAGAAYGVTARASEPAAGVAATLQRYHRANPCSLGMSPSHLCDLLHLPVRGFDAAVRYLAGGEARVRVHSGHVALSDFKPAISERLLVLRDRVLDQIRAAGVNGPARGNLMRELGIVERDMQVLSKLLTQDRTVMLLDGNFILREVYDSCRARLIALLVDRNLVDVAAFREATGANRKLAVAMLDAFDGEGLTRRVPDGRVLVKHAPGR